MMKHKNTDSEQERIAFARSQRRSSNEFADLMWQCLRNRQVFGKKFRREHPIPPYTVDFFCSELGLVIEVDGAAHLTSEGIARDQVRDKYLSDRGYRVLRIPGYELIREDGRAVELVMGVISELEGRSS